MDVSSTNPDAATRLARFLVFLANGRWLSSKALTNGIYGYFSRSIIQHEHSTSAGSLRGPLLVLESLLRAAVIPGTILTTLLRDITEGDEEEGSVLESALKELKTRLPNIRGDEILLY